MVFATLSNNFILTNGHQTLVSGSARFSWSKSLRQEGPLVGPKEVALGGALLMALTSTPMPRLLAQSPTDDWSLYCNCPKATAARPSQSYVFVSTLRSEQGRMSSRPCQRVIEPKYSAISSPSCASSLPSVTSTMA